MDFFVIFQVISLLDQEKSTLAEKLVMVTRDLDAANLDRLKRDSLAGRINDVKNKLKNFRQQFDKTM